MLGGAKRKRHQTSEMIANDPQEQTECITTSLVGCRAGIIGGTPEGAYYNEDEPTKSLEPAQKRPTRRITTQDG